jgi:hypothetical protein
MLSSRDRVRGAREEAKEGARDLSKPKQASRPVSLLTLKQL